MFQRYVGIGVVAVVVLSAPVAEAQTGKKGGGRSTAAASYRMLTGKITEIKANDHLVTIEAGAEGAKRTQTWVVSAGRQTLLLRAGKNNQFATIALEDLKKGDSIQTVVSLQTDPADQSHTGWWLVVYPPGTTAPAR